MRVLLVEDDELVAQTLVKALRDQHYTVDIATDGQAGREFAEVCAYDLIVLDVRLPKLDGITLCQQWRSRGLRTPILLLTAQDTITNKVMGLDAGADDYMTKPFEVEELLARIRALLRRGRSELSPILKWGNLHLDPSTCEVTYNERSLHLTPKEYSLLELFLRNSHRVFSRSAILDHLWSLEEIPGEETVTAHIKGLRMKLRAAGLSEDPIETVYGIGYRLKPLEKQHSPDKKQKRLSLNLEQQAKAETLSVWQRVKEKFSNRVALIEQATTAMLKDNLDEELRQLATAEAHKLAGSLGMFDLDEGSRLAKEIEQLFEAKEPLSQAPRQYLSELVAAMRRELERATARQSSALLSIDNRPLLLIAQKDGFLAQDLVSEAATWGIRGAVVKDLAVAREWVSRKRPDAVLLDLSSAATEDELGWIKELSARTPPLPVLVLTDRDSLLDRVKVARLGGQRFLQKPVTPTQVMEAIAQVMERYRMSEMRVMLVDDDPQVLSALRTLLEPWGMKLSTLDNPLRFWETLEATSPDLLVLDVQMPQISGIDLCQVVRNDPRWSALPVLFLTARNDAETMHRVFEVGADDYITKPMVGPELITRILNRLERSRLLRHLAETDALTGVANRRKSIEELNQLLQLTERYNRLFCFAILELDRFKLLNNQYGYETGDRILSRLGVLLRQAFHGEDAIARWGGVEFVVGMCGMTRNDGVRRLSAVLEALCQEEFVAPNGRAFRATFSAGVVQYPQDGTDLQALYQAADALLERSKMAGGNCIRAGEEQ
jgi:diguanylate cyclase (GGDEF)-like protein